MMGKLIVIEGTDASGKETQTAKLVERLMENGLQVRKISFPNYESPACEPVKMYLEGKFGDKALEVNPYPVSTMYAIDRYSSYKTDWEEFYKNGGIIVTDRYTTSNMVHQASKINNIQEKKEYLNWLEDLEYTKMKLPKPDLVIFLNMPVEAGLKLMSDRNNKITGEKKKDIHEKDENYLRKSYENACDIAKIYSWDNVECTEKERIKTIAEISDTLYTIVKNKVLKD